jgi:hypothetical protein
MPIPLAEMQALVGFEFPGGQVDIEKWENFLVHDVTGLEPPQHGYAHPVYAFNAPLSGMGLSYQELFDICHAESAEAIRAGGYDFQYHQPLREGVTYRTRGSILSVDRKRGKRAGLFDLVRFRLELLDSNDDLVLSATNEWIFLRSEP